MNISLHLKQTLNFLKSSKVLKIALSWYVEFCVFFILGEILFSVFSFNFLESVGFQMVIKEFQMEGCCGVLCGNFYVGQQSPRWLGIFIFEFLVLFDHGEIVKTCKMKGEQRR